MESQLDEQLDYLQDEYANLKSGPGINTFPWVEDMLNTQYLWIRAHEQCRGIPCSSLAVLCLPFHMTVFCLWIAELPGPISLCHTYSHSACVCSVQLVVTPWTVCSPPGSSVHGIFQARILEWVAISYSRGSSWPRDWTHISWVSCIAVRYFTTESPGKHLFMVRDNRDY